MEKERAPETLELERAGVTCIFGTAAPVRAAQAPRTAAGSGGNGGNGNGGSPHSSYYVQKPPRKRGRGKLIAGIVGAVLAVIVVVGGVCGFFMLRDYQEINAQVPNLMEEATFCRNMPLASAPVSW